MSTTTPEAVRTGLLSVSAAGGAELQAVAQSAEQTPTAVRAALFTAAPLVVDSYGNAAATLASDWYEELRDAAKPRKVYVPRLVVPAQEDAISASIAVATQPLYDLEREMADAAKRIEADFAQAFAESLAAVQSSVQQEIANAFRGTITDNAITDPDAAGWKRFARPEACKFCKMLAGRGAVYTRETARFAAHSAYTNGKKTGGDCMCIAGPAFGGKDTWAEASPIQYVASRRRAKDAATQAARNAQVRAYLNAHYPDAPG